MQLHPLPASTRARCRLSAGRRMLAWAVLAWVGAAPAHAEPPGPAPAGAGVGAAPVAEAAPEPAPAPEPEPEAAPAPEPAPVPASAAAAPASLAPASPIVAPAPTVAASAPAPKPAALDPAAPDSESSGSEVIEIVDRFIPGAAQSVSDKELERFEYNDVHRVLGSVPGVYMREEDGYGLRPNIGMRGSGSDRSAKIALMEDGVLIAPAPYAAPAAYYFPLVTRMARVEVLKGPAAIIYGPNTVGGAVNLISRPVPRERQATIDIAGGQDLFAKVHASAAERWQHAALMVEGVKLRSSGFKELDGGGDTGFDKNELVVKARVHTDTARPIYHQLDLKLSYADEVSDETYTGLSDADFAEAPYRRYLGTRLDHMEWTHLGASLSHTVDLAGHVAIDTTLYQYRFDRAWTKLNGFPSRDISSVLANPSAGASQVLYAVLTGQTDSSSTEEVLVIGTNDREFVSQGIQTTARTEQRLGRTTHALTAGLRLHDDEVTRLHDDADYWVTGGELMRDEQSYRITRNETGSAWALAGYVQDKMRVGQLTVTAGLRAEHIATTLVDRMAGGERSEDTQTILIPGAGLSYQVLPSLGVLIGAHRGFVPVSPGQSQEARPETSINYEAGVRYADFVSSAELIGFFSDYDNLNDPCTFAKGCSDGQIDAEYSAGAVRVYGLEAMAGTTVPVARALSLPLKLSYTLTQSRFQRGFMSAHPLWGEVEEGDELPYLPAHQLSVQVGATGALGARIWDVSVATRYTSAMRDVAGQGDLEPGEQRTEAQTVIDLALGLTMGPWGKVYATVDNVLDEAYIVSRRPYGARPGKPRMVTIGYKNQF